MKGAVRYFKNDQATDDLWNVDSTRIVIGGYSAGAILALHASHMDTTDTNIPEFILENVRLNGGIEGQANKLKNTSDVIGTVNLSGALYDRNFIDTEDPPFISFHGDADGTVPFARGLAADIITMEGSSLLHQRADEIGLRNRFDAVSGGGHTDIYTDAQFEPNRATFFRHVDNFVGSLVCPDLISRNTVIPFAGEVAISPNPASTSVSILFEKELFDVDISIYNLNGQLIQFKRNNFGDQVNLDVSKLSKGIYLVELVDQVGGTEVQKLVIK